MELQVGVKVLLKNQSGAYLLLRRSPEKYPEAANQWDIPGGRIEIGTPLFENLQREVMEETGMTVETPSLQLLAAQDIMRKDKHVVRLTYTGTTMDENVRLDSDHTEYKWVGLEEMKTLEGLDQYVQELLEKNRAKR